MTLHLDCPARVGSVLEFTYPTDNRIRVSTRLVRRRLFIRSIRDCERQPIEAWAVRRRPDLRRGPLLLRGEDLHKHEWRQFYLSSARSVREISVRLQQLALYDPLRENVPLRWIGPIWTDSRSDLQQMRWVVRQFNEYAFHTPDTFLLLRPFDVGGAP